jgi:Zn-dependent peptidase ImmA (M78 family)
MKNYEIINTNAERVALSIFKKINDPFPSVLSLMKYVESIYDLKIDIDYGDLTEYGRAGLVYFPQKMFAKIIINSKNPNCRQRFTMCHEIAHIIKDSELKYGFSDGNIYSKWGLEKFCNRFAAAFLMPKDLFIDKWHGLHDDLWKKPRMAQFFKVSGDAVYYRALELGLIKERR